VDGHDATSWGVRWTGPAAGPLSDAAACAPRRPTGVPELTVDITAASVRSIEVRTGIDPARAGAEQQVLPSRVAVRLADGRCEVLTFDSPEQPDHQRARFRTAAPVDGIVIRVLDIHGGGPGPVAVRDIVVRD
jgi:hypothetical protein